MAWASPNECVASSDRSRASQHWRWHASCSTREARGGERGVDDPPIDEIEQAGACGYQPTPASDQSQRRQLGTAHIETNPILRRSRGG